MEKDANFMSVSYICVHSALILPQQASNKRLFIYTFITKRVKLLAKNDHDKFEEQTPE